MVGVKQEFYSQLRDDYIKNGTNAFLYRYIEQEKNKNLALGKKGAKEGKRNDAYIQLKAYHQSYNDGALSTVDYLICLLQMLCKGDKIKLRKELREALFLFGKKLGGEDVFTNIKRETDKYEKLICLLQEHENLVQMGCVGVDKDILEVIHRELLECALSIDVQTFLYDIGYSVNEKGNIGQARKKDRSLDMLSAYCREKQISFSSQSVGNSKSLSDEQMEQYKQLYQALQRSNNKDVVIPIQVDTVTGAGIYIVGKNNLSPLSTAYRKMKGNCCYVCFSIDGLGVEDYNGISAFSWLLNDEENTLCNLPDLEEAIKWHLFFKGDNLCDFQERNGKAPEGCPEALRGYFDEGIETQDKLYISEEELTEAKRLFE